MNTNTVQSNVFAIAQQRGVTLLNERDEQLQQEQFILIRESRTHMVVQAYSDTRIFHVHPGWFRVIKDGVVDQSGIADGRILRGDIPRLVVLLARVLAVQFRTEQRNERPRNRAAMLRWIAAMKSDAGWQRTPEGWHLFSGYDHRRPHEWSAWIDQTTWDRLVAFTHRYKRFYHHMTEVAPQWYGVIAVPYADNSVEVTEVSRRTGAVRTRMTVAPGGDACF